MRVIRREVVRVVKYSLLETDCGDVKVYPNGTVEYYEDDGDGDFAWVVLEPTCELYRALKAQGYIRREDQFLNDSE